jgi:hypothetical protein
MRAASLWRRCSAQLCAEAARPLQAQRLALRRVRSRALCCASFSALSRDMFRLGARRRLSKEPAAGGGAAGAPALPAAQPLPPGAEKGRPGEHTAEFFYHPERDADGAHGGCRQLRV